MKLARPNWFNMHKSSVNDIPSVEIYSDGPDTDIEENLYENFEDSCRVNLSNKMPANWYLAFKRTNSELVYKRQ